MYGSLDRVDAALAILVAIVFVVGAMTAPTVSRATVVAGTAGQGGGQSSVPAGR